jgi:hypothetical protein
VILEVGKGRGGRRARCCWLIGRCSSSSWRGRLKRYGCFPYLFPPRTDQTHSLSLLFERSYFQINAFYLQKERDLRLRLLTLLSNRKRIIRLTSRSSNGDGTAGASRNGGSSLQNGIGGGNVGSKVEWRALEEGWAVFERDLGKLQVGHSSCPCLRPRMGTPCMRIER